MARLAIVAAFCVGGGSSSSTPASMIDAASSHVTTSDAALDGGGASSDWSGDSPYGVFGDKPDAEPAGASISFLAGGTPVTCANNAWAGQVGASGFPSPSCRWKRTATSPRRASISFR